MSSKERLLSFWIVICLLLPLFPIIGSTEADTVQEKSQRGPGGLEPYPLNLDIPEIEPQYVILCPENFSDEAAVLAVHRTLMGLPTVIYSLEDINNAMDGRDPEEKVHNFLSELKGDHPSLKWLLILGDSEFLMPRQLWHYAFTRGQPFGDFYYSDAYYAGLDSDWDFDGDGKFGELYYNGTVEADLNWDLYVGRVPASNETQAKNYISKLIRYETNPPVGTWMNRFLNWGSLMEPPNLETTVNRYYPHKSNAYKVCQRVKGNLPDDLDYKELYDYQQLEGGNYSMYSETDTLNRNNMLSQFNGGASMLNFVGQARYDAYALNDYGKPYGDGTIYTWNEPMGYQDHSTFTNGDMMPFMYASTCDTAKFFQTGYWEDKSLETWLTSSYGGIIGLISSTNVSARGEEQNRTWGNWYLDEEFWKLFLNSQETRPGRTMFLLKERYQDKWFTPSFEIKETIMGMIYAYILLGEPYVDVYTDSAGRFPQNIQEKLNIYQGDHSFQFTVKDRNGAPVPSAMMTIFSHSTYSTFTADENGVIDAVFDPSGDWILNITITAHNMVMSTYTVDVLEEIADPMIQADTIVITPTSYEHGDEVNISFTITNIGGKNAEGVAVRVESSRDEGGNWTLVERRMIGSLESGKDILFSNEVTVLAGEEDLRFELETPSEEITSDNNRIKVSFSIPGPSLSFEMGTGLLRPSSTVRPGSTLSMDYDVYNEGPSWGNLVLQVFLGNPEEDGIPLTEPLDRGRVEQHSWSNGTIDLSAPSGTGLLYIVMDPFDEYRDWMVDEPVKSLIVVNDAPRSNGNLTLVFLEDTGPGRIRIDDAFSDPDNTTSDMVYSFWTDENITLTMIREDLETYLEVTVVDDWWGNATIAVNASDGLSQVTTWIQLSVIPVNDPPIVKNAIDGKIKLTMVEDTPFSSVITASDKEGSPLVFSIEGAPFDINGTTGHYQLDTGPGRCWNRGMDP